MRGTNEYHWAKVYHCSVCGEWKTADAFYLDRNRKRGVSSRCKKCDRESPEGKAGWKVKEALRSGKLKRQPCEICGKEKTVAHHDDYSKPLEVRWLCYSCHRKLHDQKRGNKITDTQLETLEIIYLYQTESRMLPRLIDLTKILELNSIFTTGKRIESLVKLGVITNHGQQRGLEVNEQGENYFN